MATTVYRKLQLRRDVIANIPILDDGELFWATDVQQLWIGSNAGNIRIY